MIFAVVTSSTKKSINSLLPASIVRTRFEGQVFLACDFVGFAMNRSLLFHAVMRSLVALNQEAFRTADTFFF
jgi:hypothetical protein